MVASRTSPNIGGIEIHIAQVAPRLAQAGVDLTVMSLNPGGRLPEVEEESGVRLVRFRGWPSYGDYSVAPGIYRAIRRGGWDLIHCQGYQTLVAPLAMRAAAQAKIPYVVTLHSGGHSSGVRNRLRPFQWAALRPMLVRSDRLVALSPFEAEFFSRQLRLSPDHFDLIPNGADLPKIEYVSPSANETMVLSIGRLEHYKGHHQVLAAFPGVLEAFPHARLRVVGSGPFAGALQRMVRELGIRDHVTIGPIPTTDRASMASLIAKASLVVLLSEYESQAIAVHEALAMGRPVLVAYTSALKELVDRSMATGIPLGSSSATIAAAIIGQLRNPSINSNVALPTWDACAAELNRLYREVARHAERRVAG
jgi:glycosyltransferase involved in cell wall biosynthesis